MSLVKCNEIKPGIWELVLDRADKLNALSRDMLNDVLENLAKLKVKAEDSELRVLLVTSSSEKAFCAGADLSERIKMSAAQVPEALDQIRDVVDDLEKFPVPTIAVMSGIAFGGGLELALSCDIRIATPAAQMVLTETKLEIIPCAG